MCGIAVILSERDDELRAIGDLVSSIRHRGPDDSGEVVLPGDGIALGMARLSIIDIEGGKQPMWDEERRHVLVFNGEIYNFASLRMELEAFGHRFRSDHSDTEVLVHGYEQWGTDLFARLNGMFAVAIWDRLDRRLVLARDRTGKKPLYYAVFDGGFAVASEIKALLRLPRVSRDIDPVAVEQYLAFDYVLAPRTPLAGVRKLPGGHFGVLAGRSFDVHRYWNPTFAERAGPVSEAAAISELDELLDAAVKDRLVADVPVGLFLSGGLDSTSVGYYMRRYGAVHSFSIGFEENAFDESHYAELAARKLGTSHHLEVFSEDKVRDLVPRVADILDEPMGDQSILPTYLLSTFTQQHVKVALGGDGSDELLMGYNSFKPLKTAWRLDALPAFTRALAAGTARRLPLHIGSRTLRTVQFARRLDQSPTARLLSHLGSFKGGARAVLSTDVRRQLPVTVFDGVHDSLLHGVNGVGPGQETVAAYVRAYLQEDILVKVDRASMAASLEVRAPFLDPRIIDLALSLPESLKLRGLTGKWVLRQLMRGRIPDAVIDRPKTGFGVPLNAWLRSTLAPLVREVLDPAELRRVGLFDEHVVSRLVAEHLSGRRDHGQRIWLLVQFMLWRERWVV